MRSQRIFWGLSFAAFVFFALSLPIPTGYSYGAVAMLICSVAGFRGWQRHAMDAPTWVLFGLLLAVGMLWGMAFDGWLTWSGTDQWAKYWLAAFCLLVAAYRGVEARVIPWALAAGSLGALGIGLYQHYGLQLPKVSGFTNAIQFGGIAMYMGIATWAFALLGGYQRWHAAALWGLGCLGILASVFSGTRGAWLVAPLLMLTMWWVLLRFGRKKIAAYAIALSLILSAIAVLPLWGHVQQRIQEAVSEVHLYQTHPEAAAHTSIGQRLEQWQLGWRLGQAMPLTGWGVDGFVRGKNAYVEQGLAHPTVRDYGHVHNEILDMFAKRGLVGVSVLVLFYLLPLAIFWPSRQRIAAVPVAQQKLALALRTAASMLPIAYFGFGWTQVFFAHNSGHMFYIFSWVAMWGGIRYLEAKTRDACAQPAS